MVKSKKMSKTSIAVIVLSLLLVLSMVLSLTGAWFTNTDNASDSGQGANVVFGTFGDVSIVLTNAEWNEHVDGAEELTPVNTASRTYYMPGDEVKSTGLQIAYNATWDSENDEWDDNTAVNEGTVYYVIGMRNKASGSFTNESYSYFVVNDQNKLAPESAEAGTITQGTPLAVAAGVRTVKVNFGTAQSPVWKYYKLDGDITSDATGVDAQSHAALSAENPGHSWEIENHAQGAGLVSIDGIAADGVTEYRVNIIQSTNLSAAEAFVILTASNMGGMQIPAVIPEP